MTAPTGTEFVLSAEEEAALGDPGKAAIDRMKEAQKSALARAAVAEAALAQARAPKVEPIAPTVEPQAGQPVDVAALVAAETAKFRAEALREKASDKLEARAATQLADAGDAARYLKIDDYVVNGSIDVAAMDAAITELVKSKPYLSKDGAKPHFEGSADAGPKENAASSKSQLGQGDLDRLVAQGVPGALKIEQYRQEGRFNDLLKIKR